MNENCALCESPVVREGYRDVEKIFCCAGCQAVYQILSAQSALEGFQQHPLFRQALKSGLIANPDLIEQIRKADCSAPEEEYKKLHLEIQDMWCPSCAKVIQFILLRERGVRHCIVDYATDLASIEYTPRYIPEEKILKIIKQFGYQPAFLQDTRQKAVSRSLTLRFIIAAFFSLNIMMFSYPIYASYFDSELLGYSELFGWLSLASAIPVLTYSAWPIWRRFYSALHAGIWGMEALVFMGIAAAFGLSLYELLKGSLYVYFDSMTVIIVFVLMGKIIESKAKYSAKDALIQLTRALPRRGRKQLPDGTGCFLPLKEIQPGDRLIILSGEKIVLDGVVEAGEGACDESLMTGESLPVTKQAGAKVLAGTLLQQGNIVIRVTSQLEETALHRIIEMVEQDIGHKSQYVRSADQIVKWFVPIVLTLALATALCCLSFNLHDGTHSAWQTALLRAISIILISCPCAIGIAAPLAESYVLNALAKMGAIVRNRGCLPFLGKETVFICDKTGTVTEGKFTPLKGLECLSLEDRSIVRGLVEKSTHPIALALQQGLPNPPASFDFIEEVAGRGVKGTHEGCRYLLGSAAFLQQHGIKTEIQDQTKIKGVHTVVYYAKGEECISEIVLGDRLRPDVKELVASFSPIKTFLVSGDHAACVEYVARACGFTGWHAGYHPLQKREFVNQLREQGEVVVMLGDGINDAPALTAAHAGIAVVSATDISIQVSDILLTTHQLNTISKIRKIAVKGQKIVKQNLFWAFFYNCLGIGLAMAGFLTPLFAAFAMVMSSLIVLLNAHRLHQR
ncbi:MAG: heavy metal translocating P-type ATPase [Chlamydiales bacterium]